MERNQIIEMMLKEKDMTEKWKSIISRIESQVYVSLMCNNGFTHKLYHHSLEMSSYSETTHVTSIILAKNVLIKML